MHCPSDGLKMPKSEDIVRELTILRAECSPLYLLAQHKCDSVDPIQRAFSLIKKCTTLMNQSNTLVDEKIQVIRGGLEEFTAKMLDLCDDLNEAEILLSRDDGLLNFRGRMPTLPRIRVAIQYQNNCLTCLTWG